MPLRAITALSLAMLMFALQDALLKQLTQSYPVLQLLFLRMNFVVLVLLVLWFLHRESVVLKTTQWPLMACRGAAAYGAFFLYYLALQRGGLAESATVLMSAPLFVTALSVPFLGEQVGVHRWTAVCVGFAAVIMMLRPGTALFQPIMVLPLIAAVVYAFIPIITRIIDSGVSAFAITFHTAVAYWLLCLASAALVYAKPATADSHRAYQAFAQPWNTPDNEVIAIVAACAVLMLLSIFLLTFAYRQAQVSFLTSFEYSYLVWAMLVAYVMFDETPTLLTYFAALVIMGCGMYIAWREHRNAADRPT